jgi:A/G-specific adenine glycosylase
MVHTSNEEYLDKFNLTWFRRRLKNWAKKNLRDFPWRETKDPYAIFVAEFLLQQTDAPRVVPVYLKLLGTYPTLTSLAEAETSELSEILKPLGFHFRAERLQNAARLMIEDPVCKGNIPDKEEVLLQILGVGKYIARSVCANAFGQPTAILDTNVIRILQRFFGLQSRRARPRNDPHLWSAAQEAAPKMNVGSWNLTLLDFGAAVCTFHNPKCEGCPLNKQCNYFSSSLLRQNIKRKKQLPTKQ